MSDTPFMYVFMSKMYYSIILNTNTSQPMPQYYKWMYEEKKLMCDCCLTKLHCFSTSYKDKIENIWTTKEVEKKVLNVLNQEKRKKRKKRSYFYLFRPIKCFIQHFSVCVRVYMKKSKNVRCSKVHMFWEGHKNFKNKITTFFELTKYCQIK